MTFQNGRNVKHSPKMQKGVDAKRDFIAIGKLTFVEILNMLTWMSKLNKNKIGGKVVAPNVCSSA